MAGTGGVARVIDMAFEMFDRILNVNRYGSRHVVEAVLVSMAPALGVNYYPGGQSRLV